jgi:hypothetical protein
MHLHSGQLYQGVNGGEIFLLQAIPVDGREMRYVLLHVGLESSWPEHAVLTAAFRDNSPLCGPLSEIEALIRENGLQLVTNVRLGYVPQSERLEQNARLLHRFATYLSGAAIPSQAEGYISTRAEMACGHNYDDKCYTMIGLLRLMNICDLAKVVFQHKIPGDFCECGVWRGGAVIFMKALLDSYNEKRKVFVCDSFKGFEGITHSTETDDNRMESLMKDFPSASEEQVRANFEKFELLDESVVFVPGFFKESLATAPIEKLSILRLDADLYEPTLTVLETLYPKVVPGGFVIVDDYLNVPACAQAVRDYFKDKLPGMCQIDWSGVWFQKLSV